MKKFLLALALLWALPAQADILIDQPNGINAIVSATPQGASPTTPQTLNVICPTCGGSTTVSPTPGSSTDLTLNKVLGRVIEVTDPVFGAKCDVASSSGSIASGSSTLPGTYTAADVNKVVRFDGADPSGFPLYTTIASVSGGVATLTTPAGAASSASTSYASSFVVPTLGTGYVPGEVSIVAGGSNTVVTKIQVTTTQVSGTPGIPAGGSGGTNTNVLLVGTTGTGNRFILRGVVSGGALTSVSTFVDRGSYTVNPTSLTNEPVVAYNLNGAQDATAVNISQTDRTSLLLNPLAGAQVSLTMGVGQAVISQPGSYATAPANPANQASSTGAGTGVQYTLAYANGGSFQYGTDDATPIQAAIAAGSGLTNTTVPNVLFPKNLCAITTGLTVTASFLSLDGGPYYGTRHNVAPTLASAAGLRAFGTLATGNGTMLKVAPVVSGSNPTLNGVSVRGLSFLCGGVGTSGAGIGLQILGTNPSKVELTYADECTTADYDVGSIDGLGENGNLSPTMNEFQSYNLRTNGVGLRVSNTTSGNTNFGGITQFRADHQNAPALQVIGADNMNFSNLHLFRPSGGFAYSVELTGSASVAFPANSIHFWHLGAQGGVIARGKETSFIGTLPASTYNNEIRGGNDISNADPWPVSGIGATLMVQREDGVTAGVLSMNGTFGSSISDLVSAEQRRVASSSVYVYNGSDGHIYLDDGTSKWRIYTDAADQSLHIVRVAGTGKVTTGNDVSITSTTDASSTATGALIVSGGGVIAKRFWIPAISASAGLQTAVLCQSSGGEMIADSVACLASGSQFKNIIGPLPNGALNKLVRLPVDRWSYKAEGNFTSADWTRERIGPIAQDVAAMDPRLAGYDKEGNVRTYSTEQLLAFTIKAVQELKADNDNIRSELQSLKRRAGSKH